jgi:preprotein translocase subunit SecY
MIIKHLEKIWTTEHIRKKILVTLGIIVIYKLFSAIPVPGVKVGLLDAFTTQLQANQQLAFFGALM